MILGVADHPSFKGSLNEFLSFASTLKVDVVELRLDRLELLSLLHTKQNKTRIREIKDVLESYDFKRFVHMPSIGVNLASLNKTLREASEKTLIEAVKFAAEINAELTITHVGRLSKDYPKNFIKKSVKNAVDSLTKINKLSKNLGTAFTIENDHKTGDYVLAGHVEQLKFILENVECMLTFDVGHANTLGNPEEFAEQLKDYILNVHLHDNDGLKDAHLPLGKGTINFKEIIRKIGGCKNLPLILECHSFEGLKESLIFVRRRLNH